MSRATLVIMAAGIGSRFGGGIKQLAPIGPYGEIIMDYSVYDAIEAGFDKVVFVIRKDLEKDFKEVIGNRIAQKVEVAYAYQEVSDIPAEYAEKFVGRTKPWGTGQAILCCKDVVSEPFLVINADDYYGKSAFKEAYSYLTSIPSADKIQVCMVGFVLKNTFPASSAAPPVIDTVEPPLKPNQQNQRIKQPKAPSGMECPGIAFDFPFLSYLPIRGPRMMAPIRAATPPTICTAQEPAKS